MLELAILDNVEQINSKQPQINQNGITYGLISQGDSTVASSLAQMLATIGAANTTSKKAVYPVSIADYSKVWFSGNNTTALKCALFDVTTETIAFDDAGAKGLCQIVTDNGGTVWAQGTAAGNYGLWKRTGAGTWTQILTDSTQAVGVRWRASDNTLWYQSSTSNNYQLANGAATLTTAPTGTLVTVSVSNYFPNFDAPFANYNGMSSSYPATSIFYWGDGAANNALSMPYDTWVNWGSTAGLSLVWQVHIDSTYSLVIVPGNSASTTAYYLYLVNKLSSTVKYIGTCPLPSIKGGTPSASTLFPFLAKWVSTSLRLYFVGSVVDAGAAGTAGNLGGIVRVDLPFVPNF